MRLAGNFYTLIFAPGSRTIEILIFRDFFRLLLPFFFLLFERELGASTKMRVRHAIVTCKYLTLRIPTLGASLPASRSVFFSVFLFFVSPSPPPPRFCLPAGRFPPIYFCREREPVRGRVIREKKCAPRTNTLMKLFRSSPPSPPSLSLSLSSADGELRH